MKCETCGNDNPSDKKFCEKCGNILAPESPEKSVEQPVTPPSTQEKDSPAEQPAASTPNSDTSGVECPICKYHNPIDATFCDECGVSLQKEIPAESEEPVEEEAAPAEPAVPTTKVLVLPDDSEIVLDAKKTFGRIDFTEHATEPMWISRKHFSVFEEDGIYYIEDEGSSNGTKLNGKEIRQAGKQQLNDGDEIVVGDSIKVVFKTK